MTFSDAGSVPVPAVHAPDQTPDFLALRAIMDNLGKATASGQGIDWDAAARHADAVLRHSCKHLRVAAYLAVALMRTRGLSGFADGIGILGDILSLYWETMLPPADRMRGRLNAVLWWHEQAREFARSYEDAGTYPELGAALLAQVRALQRALDERFGEQAPLLREFVRFAEQVRGPEERSELLPPVLLAYENQDATPGGGEQKPDAQSTSATHRSEGDSGPEPSSSEEALSTPKRAAASDPPDPKPQASSFPVAADERQASEESPEDVLDAALEELARAADLFAQRGALHPLRFAAFCQSLWLPISRLPEADAHERTNLPSPGDGLREAVSRIQEAARPDAPEHIECAGMALREHRFWMDAAHALVCALRASGEDECATRVSRETRAFVAAFPDVARLRFSDGAPMVNDAAKAWLRELCPADSNTQWSADAVFPTPLKEETAASHPQKEDALAEKSPLSPSFFPEPGKPALSGRERLRFALTRAHSPTFSGNREAAAFWCDAIHSLLLEHRLDDWEPALARDAWETLAGLRTGEGRLEALKHLFRLDPESARRLAERSE